MTEGITERLKTEIRKATRRGMKQRDIAQRAGLHESQVSAMMNARPGTRVPKLTTADALAKAIGLKLVLKR